MRAVRKMLSKNLAFLIAAAAISACSSNNSGSGDANALHSGNYIELMAVVGMPVLPTLPQGRPANLALLEPQEREVVAAADARAADIRSTTLNLSVDQPNIEVTIRQVRHGFTFGFPIELKRFTHRDPEDLQWYTARMSEHFSLAVLESDAKWAVVEPNEGVRDFNAADENVAWAEENGFQVKGHTLLWGLPMPLSGAALPKWAEDKFPSTDLSAAETAELRGLLKAFIQDSVAHFKGRLAYWDVTNETLQPLAQWFINRLGPGIVEDAYVWAREMDPDVELVFNEWIVEVFTGFNSPTAADVRDRVMQLQAADVPIAAIGQQGHFAPTLAFADPTQDISGRTNIVEYADALDILAEAGLPIHITETNFIAPEEPELRAAQAEALMRLWWGHPSVEMVVFWGPWNKVAGRDEFNVGFWDDDRAITRHGEAVFALLNDEWRTNVTVTADADGQIELTAFYGDYIAYWTVDGTTYHVPFTVENTDDVNGFAFQTPIETAP
ncbi:Anti-sigma-I factor RsgI6 [Halioglobus japonicus]|nr:Anti-sigma-I factor RsgI6 [Halioglobus japonicus]